MPPTAEGIFHGHPQNIFYSKIRYKMNTVYMYLVPHISLKILPHITSRQK